MSKLKTSYDGEAEVEASILASMLKPRTNKQSLLVFTSSALHQNCINHRENIKPYYQQPLAWNKKRAQGGTEGPRVKG